MQKLEVRFPHQDVLTVIENCRWDTEEWQMQGLDGQTLSFQYEDGNLVVTIWGPDPPTAEVARWEDDGG